MLRIWPEVKFQQTEKILWRMAVLKLLYIRIKWDVKGAGEIKAGKYLRSKKNEHIIYIGGYSLYLNFTVHRDAIWEARTMMVSVVLSYGCGCVFKGFRKENYSDILKIYYFRCTKTIDWSLSGKLQASDMTTYHYHLS